MNNFNDDKTNIIQTCAHQAFRCNPKPWQSNMLSKLIDAMNPNNTACSAPLFLCQPTGGGKSIVRGAHSAMHGGIIASISPLLTLSADQETKLNDCVNLNNCSIIGMRVDHCKIPAQQQLLISKIKKTPHETQSSIALFSSPQALVNIRSWRNLLRHAIDQKLLKMVCVDEAHLFCNFGLRFRKEFSMLKPILFQKLIIDSNPLRASAPALFMAATASKDICNGCMKLTGLRCVIPTNIFWPPPTLMRQRDISLEVACATQPLSFFKKKLLKFCTKCSITFTNLICAHLVCA